MYGMGQPTMNSAVSPRRLSRCAVISTTHIGRLAIHSLYREVALSPKPGLVSPDSQGSHADMNYATFLRSLYALRPYFMAITQYGSTHPSLRPLQELGIRAEVEMLAATKGVNTHRGAIFNLGLLCAAAGLIMAEGQLPSAQAACDAVKITWGSEILAGLLPQSTVPDQSHGLIVARRYGSGGARQEAAAGFPAAMEVGLPAYRSALAASGDADLAAIQTLFALMAELDDTNLLWRGGREGLAFGRRAAANFLTAGGVFAENWREHAETINLDFVAHRLSPGGSADLLGVTLFLAELDGLV
jgi:triphosphoribosyl-dephospho-CoA synthase